MKRLRTAASCRACGAVGPAYFAPVLGHSVALCPPCRGDYNRAECACDIRGHEVDKAAAAAAAKGGKS